MPERAVARNEPRPVPFDEPLRDAHGERLDLAFTPARGAPAPDPRPPLVLIAHGVTSHHDRPYLVALAERLADAGLSSLRLSFAGNGASEGRFEDATLSKEVDDLGAVLDACAGWRVGYAGHSMGGAVGVLRAATDPRLEALVSLAGMTHVQRFVSTHLGPLRPGRDVMLGRPHARLSRAFLDDAARIGDVLDAAARVRVPWLLVHGTADELVPLQDATDARDAARAGATRTGATPDVELAPLDGADHVFTGRIDEMTHRVTTWLAERLRR